MIAKFTQLTVKKDFVKKMFASSVFMNRVKTIWHSQRENPAGCGAR
jgi:hypothetical protein